MSVREDDPPWLKRAFDDLGLKEVPGAKSNPRIVEMYALAKNAGVKDDSVPWCSAAMNAWMVESGRSGTRSLLARSWLEWGAKIDTSKKMPRGSVLVFRRGTSSWQGHVCLLVEDNGATLQVIGGNQSDAVTLARYKRTTLVGARWPEVVTKPKQETKVIKPTEPKSNPQPDVEPIEAPEPAPEKKSMIRRVVEWFAGIGGLGGLGFATLDWKAVVAFGAVAIAGVLVWHFIIKPRRRK